MKNKEGDVIGREGSVITFRVKTSNINAVVWTDYKKTLFYML